MMTDLDAEHDPIAWMAVPDRHPVLAADGTVAAYVAARLGDTRDGRFDGFVIGIDVPREIDPRLMLEVDHVTEITTAAVHTDCTAEQLAALPGYVPDKQWAPRLKPRKRRR